MQSTLEEDIVMKILAVMAHPDDAEVWSGGTLAKYTANGHQGHVVVMTYSENDLRGMEAIESARVLGCTIDLMGYPDTGLRETDEATDRVGEILARETPQVVLVHNPDDTHPDHEASFRVARRAILRWYAGPKRPASIPSVFAANTYRGIGLRGPVQLNAFVDISSVWGTKIQALQAHRSQGSENWFHRLRTAAEFLGSQIGYPLAEGFRHLVLFSEPGTVPNLDPGPPPGTSQ
jgi:LmbE family N-acetylglucosaminyl deacetylase